MAKKVKKDKEVEVEEVKVEEEEEVKEVEEVKVEETKVEEPKFQECPADACELLLDAWSKGIHGCFDPNSKWCKLCLVDLPKTAEICKAGTVSKMEEKKDKIKVKTVRKPSADKNFLGHGGAYAVIDSELADGATMKDIVEELKAKNLHNDREDKVIINRINSHITGLKKDHEVDILKVEGKLTWKRNEKGELIWKR
jgi:hypothetical protein